MIFLVIYSIFFKQKSEILLLLASICYINSSIAQSSVITSGNVVENEYGSVSFTIGSVFYIGKAQTFSITEGLQQSYIINQIPGKSILKVLLYPNPTSDLIFFKVENLNFKNLSYRIYDLTGRLMSEGKINNINTSVSLQKFNSNIFIVRIYRNAIEERSFKIFKAL